MINNGFMYWIFFGLSKMVYGTIPALYDAFIFFAKYQFFDIDTDIRQIWGNLYVLLSVLVLFAIAIKLINAIVNPDVLTDKKKGVKKAYFSAIIAVFLTVLTPYAFTLLVHVQDSIIDNKTIEKLFFNTTSAEQNGGKVVAWTAITSFINLNELADATEGTSHQYILDTSALGYQETQIYVLEEEVDTGLSAIYNAQPWQHTDTVHQNPILMLLAGCLIAYEFILLVLDTALRSIKLGLLQMMTPIILGAYIFKEDILKKWALEYIKTFIQIFLLFISISLLTKVLALLPKILVGAEFTGSSDRWLLAGIINVLAIMAALRLVKQVVPLINKIFGTNIQGKGGIKGRLGEMAMVGGLAQKAWSALGNGAKGLATTVPLAAAAGLGFAGKKAGNFLKNSDLGNAVLNSRFGSGLKKAGRVASIAGGYGKVALAGINAGGGTKSYKALQEANKKRATISNARDKVAITNKAYDIGRDLMGIEQGGAAKKGTPEFQNGLKRDIFIGQKNQRLTNSADLAADFHNRINDHVNSSGLIGQDLKDYHNYLTNKIKSSNMENIKSKYDGLISDMKTSNDDEVARWGRMIESGERTLDQAISSGIVEQGGLTSAYRNLSNLVENYDAFSGTNLTKNMNGTSIGIELGNVKSAYGDSETIVKAIKDPNVLSETDLAIMEGGEAAIMKRNDNIKGWGWKTDPSSSSSASTTSSSASSTTYSSTTSSSSSNTSSSSTSSSSASTSSTSTVSQPESLNTGASSDRSYFDAQIDARMDYLEGKDTLTAAEEAELRSLQQTERAAQREYEQTQEYRDQQAQEQHDREVQERNAEIEELNRRANNRPLTRAEQMRREQLNSAKEYDENGGSIDE